MNQPKTPKPDQIDWFSSQPGFAKQETKNYGCSFRKFKPNCTETNQMIYTHYSIKGASNVGAVLILPEKDILFISFLSLKKKMGQILQDQTYET